MNLKGSELFLWVLIGLAIVASVLMMFSSSDAWQKIAVLAALWAAAVGAFLVMRMRGQATADSERMAELEDELDYQRARADEERARSESAIARYEESDETLAAIRDQLEAMRAQLEELTGRTYEYEPNSITASATRLREIGSSTSGTRGWDEEPHTEPESVGAPSFGEPDASTAAASREATDVEVVTAEYDQHGSHAERQDDEAINNFREEEESDGGRQSWTWTPGEFSSYVEPEDNDQGYHGKRRKEDDKDNSPFNFDFFGSYASSDTDDDDAGAAVTVDEADSRRNRTETAAATDADYLHSTREEEPSQGRTRRSGASVADGEDTGYHGRRRKEDRNENRTAGTDNSAHHAGGGARPQQSEESHRVGGWTPVTQPVDTHDTWGDPHTDGSVDGDAAGDIAGETGGTAPEPTAPRPDQTARIPQVDERQEESGHGRRRAENNAGGVSVADLLKNLKK